MQDQIQVFLAWFHVPPKLSPQLSVLPAGAMHSIPGPEILLTAPPDGPHFTQELWGQGICCTLNIKQEYLLQLLVLNIDSDVYLQISVTQIE